MPTDMVFRKIEHRDVDCMALFQQRMALETEGLCLEKKTLIKGIEAILSSPNKGTYYIAEIDERAIGCLMTTAEWSEWHNGEFVWIQSVFVVPEYRGKGIYKKMYRYIQKRVEQGAMLKGIRLYVDRSNVSAQKVYEKLGMDSTHYSMYEWKKS